MHAAQPTLPAARHLRSTPPSRLQDVAQSALETAVPSRPGASVLVVLGSQRGQPGRLLERRTGDGLAVVQVHADMRVRKVYLDQVAEYVGPDAS